MSEVDVGSIAGVQIQQNHKLLDFRGSFVKFLDKDLLDIKDADYDIRSFAIATTTETGTVRGLHFQVAPFQEEKVITCLQGEIIDVVVDLRNGSRTQGKWAQISLSADVSTTIYLPKGIAHGYQTLTQDVVMFYGLSSSFDESSAYSLKYSDNELGINWPLPVRNISHKDLNGISLSHALMLMSKENLG